MKIKKGEIKTSSSSARYILFYAFRKKERFAGENPNNIRISKTLKTKNVKPILMEKEVIDFLDSILAENTRKNYTRALEVFEKYTNKTITEIITQRRVDFTSNDIAVKRSLEREVERFYTWLIKERKLAQNTGYVYVTAIKSIMSFYDINLKLKRIKRTLTLTNDWVPSPNQLREVFNVGDLTEKTIIALATNIPLRINDFNEIRKKDIIPLLKSSEYPVHFMLVTKKTKTPMPCFITEETMNLLRKYVKTLREDNPFLFQGQGQKKLNEDSINRILKKLVKKSDIDTREQRVRFHLFRKVFISIARSMIGLSDDQIKMLTGKRVKGDMNPYYVNVQLKPLFLKVVEKLRFTGISTQNHVTIDQMQKTIANQQVEIQDFKTRLEALTINYSKLNEKMAQMSMDFMEMSSVVQPFMTDLEEKRPLLELIYKQEEERKRKDRLKKQNRQ